VLLWHSAQMRWTGFHAAWVSSAAAAEQSGAQIARVSASIGRNLCTAVRDELTMHSFANCCSGSNYLMAL
jgi:hypothetical protein